MRRPIWLAVPLLIATAGCSDDTTESPSTATDAPAVAPTSPAPSTTSAATDPPTTSAAPTTTGPADAPVPSAEVAFTLPDGFQYPENLAWDPSTGRVYVSSPQSGGAVAVAEPGAGTASIWLPAGTDGMFGALGIEFGHGSIWIVTGGGVWEYGPDGGRRSVHLAPEGGLNDVAITDDGVYVTDTGRPTLWHVPLDAPNGEALRPIDIGALAPEAVGQGFNGIEALPDGTLIVGPFGLGPLFHVDPRAPSAVAIDLGGYQYLAGDGMSLDGDDLWLVHGSWMDSVDRIRLCPSYDCGTVVEGAVDPNLSFPTDVQVVDGAVLAVNSQFDSGGGLGDGVPTLPFWVSAIPLS